MSGDRHEQARPGGSGQHPPIPQAAPADSQDNTWDGGGREPVHPDDIDNEGVYVGKNMPKQQLRSDDN